jgi:pyridoxal phosphate-dependent aminotransferase EpsN
MEKRLYLSPPHMCGKELEFVKNAFDANWIAPAGPDITAFENEMCLYTGSSHAVALSSGTAALHLALQLCGVGPGDDVICSTFTFAGSVFPVHYLGANPIFIDSEQKSWNMDPDLLERAIKESLSVNKKPAAVIVVHLYGQSADMSNLMRICQKYNIPLIEDAAESVGSFFGDRHTGTFGRFGVFSFNGNKIITTSGGGMLIGIEKDDIDKARHLSTQAREPFPYYEHEIVGYNYRMSNILAAIGRGQLTALEERVERRRQIFEAYNQRFDDIQGISMMPVVTWGRPNYWLTCIQVDTINTNVIPETLRLALESENIESRPVWKPMHLQPVFRTCRAYLNGVSDGIYSMGLCLPSGSSITESEIDNVASVIIKCMKR